MEIKKFNIDLYLMRINYTGSRFPTFETLSTLCWNHVTSIPVDTLDIFNNQKKDLDLDAIYNNIIMNGRGGWCYELNGLFAVLLTALGYDVTLLEGSCYMPTYDKFSGPFDHLYLKVFHSKSFYNFVLCCSLPAVFLEKLLCSKLL